MQCKQLSTAMVCYTPAVGVPQTLVAHYEYRDDASGDTVLHATRYTDAAGVVINTSTGTVAAGMCAILPADVEWEKLCDVSPAGVVTEFFRRSITTFNGAGVPTTTTADFELDKTTAYAPAGDVMACNMDCDVVAPVGLVTSWG